MSTKPIRLATIISAAGLLAFVLSQCAGPISQPPPSGSAFRYAPAASSDYAERAAPKPGERPGLGTQLGHDIWHDSSAPAVFYRKSQRIPDAVATFHYNDAEGAKLMAELMGHAMKHGGAFELVPGKLRVALVSRSGSRAYDHYLANGKVFVIGMPGDSYEVRLENLTKAQMEVVMSIDGLDVLDGQPASVSKRGYVVAPRSAVTIEGMRVGGKLKTLIFSTVAGSRAATAFGVSGARNVGVIGVACYEEDDAARRRARVEENYLRGDARAFGR